MSQLAAPNVVILGLVRRVVARIQRSAKSDEQKSVPRQQRGEEDGSSLLAFAPAAEYVAHWILGTSARMTEEVAALNRT
jgi:hypothetical protein